MKLIRQILDMFEVRERWRLLGLGLSMLLMAVMEVIGVASIMPFMQVVSNPDLVQENHWLSGVYEALDFSSTRAFLIFLGFALLGLIAINNGLSAFTMWLMHRFAAGQQHRLSIRLLSRYLARPYDFYLGCNTAGLSKNILAEVQTVINGVMLAVLRLLARGLVALMIIGLLAAVDPVLAVFVGGILGGAYGIVYSLLRRKQRRLGQERYTENRRRFQVAAEALTGIKDVKVLGRESAFLARFRQPSWRFCRATASNHVVSKLPRYALETIAFGGIVLIVLYSLQFSGDIQGILPVLSLYAFAGYRLMPAINDIFMSAVSIRFSRVALDGLHQDLTGDFGEDSDSSVRARLEEPLPFHRQLALKDLSFTYAGAATPSINHLDLTVERRQVVGLVGETGSGKTTLVDIILGLLQPTEGVIQVDGEPLLGERVRRWRRSCGYVPQEIFLSDDSIRANIAFGIPSEKIEEEAVVRAARMAQIDDFIQALPEGYETVVGERGVRLSGGQRQRIGIARALYHDPQVLIMDEATSSLDGATEAAVMDMIHCLGQEKTLIVIAHRLSTVQTCEIIHLLENGRIVASGTYEELARTNRKFRAMAGMSALVVEDR
ncbi:MAG: ABC transporter ATP-binding protein/permease [Acidobacteria bacterium]|nr:ABC transporter ATP-binding protein/permease [Acidobacteriota bacterium]